MTPVEAYLAGKYLVAIPTAWADFNLIQRVAWISAYGIWRTNIVTRS